MTTQLRPVSPPAVEVDGDIVTVSDLAVRDRNLSELLTTSPPEEWEALVTRALGVGARGLLTMGLGLDVSAADERLRATLARLTDEAEHRLRNVIAEGRAALTEELDPDRRSSLLGRAREDLGALRDTLLSQIDPGNEGSHTTRFLRMLEDAIGPGGSLDQRLSEALDPTADGSGLATLAETVGNHFRDLRELIVREEGVAQGRADEATRGTAQGVDFEDVVEGALRSWAASVGGCVVERTGRTPGALGSHSVVGDFVVTFPDGTRLAVEAKNQATLRLTGKDGILAELDRAMENREAVGAVCVSSRPSYPAEVGSFGVYGPRILVVDDGDGTMLGVALQWARARAAVDRGGRSNAVDVGAVSERVAAIKRLAERLRSARAGVTEIRKSAESLHETLGDLRTDILEQAVEAERLLATGPG